MWLHAYLGPEEVHGCDAPKHRHIHHCLHGASGQQPVNSCDLVDCHSLNVLSTYRLDVSGQLTQGDEGRYAHPLLVLRKSALVTVWHVPQPVSWEQLQSSQ